ncbi:MULTISPECIES: hypothetical protein [unclassified Streptomyces]|jgi:hypothetical protein|uniref:hypothetical protein n=1 Tax=unclassified Streptomyces TaxID=2593676 RepID=UPI002E775645|nr:hypothetical protein [Streptomyces sp. JV184]MEE1750424.1 hypothetical protein [Streptomyces sp. JV184]
MTTMRMATERQSGTADAADMAGTTGTGRMPVGAALLAGPVLMAGYGVVRLVGRAVGDYGPGVWWTAAHLLFLAGVLAFVPVFLGLRKLAGERGGGRVAAEVAAWTGLLGAAAVVVQAVIDLTAGFVSADKEAMSEMFDRVQGVPGVMPLVYTVVPMLFWLGLLALVTLLAFLRRDLVRAWTPVLVLAGTAAMAVSLDLLPVGALCLGVALLPVRRGLSG